MLWFILAFLCFVVSAIMLSVGHRWSMVILAVGLGFLTVGVSGGFEIQIGK